MRILLDHNTPVGVRNMLTGHEVRSAYEMGWDELTNGRLLGAAEAEGFDVMVTGDQRIKSQQNLTGRRLAILALSITHWPTIQQHPDRIRDAVERAGEGGYVEVAFPRPRLNRRPAPPQPG